MKRSVFKAMSIAVIICVPWLIFGDAGRQIFDFLYLPDGARSAGLSGSSMGMIGDPFALFSSPAGLEGVGRKAGFTYTRYVADIQGGCGTYVLPVAGGTFGGGISYLNYGELPKTDEAGVDLGTFTPQSLMPVFGYSRRLNHSLIGLSLKTIYQTIEEHMSVGIAAGFGYLFYPEQWEGLVIGGTIQNLGIQVVEFDETKESLPFFARIGASYPFFNKLVQASAELQLPEIEFILGVEWEPSKIFAIRCGYYSWGSDLEVGGDLDIFAGKSFGFGFKTKKLHLDYALTPMVELGVVHRISLTYLFAEVAEEEEPEPEEEGPEEE